jgi:hypothetical protein
MFNSLSHKQRRDVRTSEWRNLCPDACFANFRAAIVAHLNAEVTGPLRQTSYTDGCEILLVKEKQLPR